ncbi:MAG: DUF2142 domain-containing protein [Anaerolineae bacterium]|nr:DUF2142 domain-containing protein [Anaerolineae bacterium]
MPGQVWERRALAAAIVVHVLLGAYYSVMIPAWEANDEIGHFYFVRHLATERRLPTPGDRLVEENDESRQPPLYYLLAALPVAFVDVSDGVEPHLNPYMWWGPPLGGCNRVVHDCPCESWPYRGTMLALHIARLVSVLVGAVALLLTFWAARQAFPAQPWVRWGALIVLALWPQFRFATAIVNNDIMAAASGAAVTWLLLRCAMATAPRARDIAALGGAVGIALLSKNSTLALLPVVALVFARSIAAAEPGTRRALLPHMVGGITVGLVAVGWWYARNVTGGTGMFGGAYSLRAAVRLLMQGLTAQGAPGWELIPPTLSTGLFSLWAAFGWANVWLPAAIYRAAAAGGVLGLLGLLLWCLRRRQGSQALGAATLALVVASVIGTWLYFTVTRHQTTLPGRYLLPALPALSILLSLGWNTLLPRLCRAVGWSTIAGALAALAIAVPVLYIRPVYALPPQATAAEAATYRPAHFTFGHFAELVGYRIEQDTVDPDGTLRLSLLWRVLGQSSRDYTLAVQVFEPERHMVGEVQRFPGGGALATTTWQPGQVFAEDVPIPIRRAAPEATIAWVELSYFDRERLGLPIEVHSADGQFVGYSIRLGRIKIRGRAAPLLITPHHSLQFGAAVRLARCEVDAYMPARAPRLDLDLHWTAAHRPDRDYTVSIQLRDVRDVIAAQVDQQPQGGRYPTSFWDPAELVRDHYRLPLPQNLGAGTYTLYACMYDVAVMRRLPVSTHTGERYAHDEVPLATLSVSAGGEMEVRPGNPLVSVTTIATGAGRAR